MVLPTLQHVVEKPTTRKHAIVSPLDRHKGKTTRRLPARRKQRGGNQQRDQGNCENQKHQRKQFSRILCMGHQFRRSPGFFLFFCFLFFGFFGFLGFFGFCWFLWVFFGFFVVFYYLLVSLVFFAFMVFVVFFEMYLAVCCGRLQGLYNFCNS